MERFFDFFRMTRKERRGFWVLFCLLVAVVLFPGVYHLSRPTASIDYELVALPSDNKTDFRALDQEVAPGLAERSYTKAKPVAELFYFDPNGLSVSDWQRLGLSPKQAQVIKNYEAKGGKFRTKEDVRKMFVISEERYAALEPFIQIKQKESDTRPKLEYRQANEVREARSAMVVESTAIDINTADTTEWKSLRGIGTAYANRIVRFRDALGGFHDIEQLREVYGMTEELFEQISPRLVTDQPLFRKIPINSSSQEELKKHAYINYKQAQAIVRYRHQHGNFSSIEDLRKIIILDESFLRKIEPYLAFEN